MKALSLAFLLLILSGCTSTEVAFDNHRVQVLKPSYEDYFDYYLFGFIGRRSVSLPAVCLDQKPYRLQVVRSSEDSIIALYTLGIYTPLTVRVWCGD